MIEVSGGNTHKAAHRCVLWGPRPIRRRPRHRPNPFTTQLRAAFVDSPHHDTMINSSTVSQSFHRTLQLHQSEKQALKANGLHAQSSNLSTVMSPGCCRGRTYVMKHNQQKKKNYRKYLSFFRLQKHKIYHIKKRCTMVVK